MLDDARARPFGFGATGTTDLGHAQPEIIPADEGGRAWSTMPKYPTRVGESRRFAAAAPSRMLVPGFMADDWLSKISDPTRLAILRNSGLLDSAVEESFDRITELSAELLDSPIALVSLVDEQRQFFKSALGVAEPHASRRETPLSYSFCKHVVASGEPLIVSDARDVPYLRDNRAVTELGVIAYAGVPLETEGATIGAFCAIDTKPRNWSEADVRVLRELGRAVQAQIELRWLNAELAAREEVLDAVLNTMPAGVLVRDVPGAVVRTNPALQKLLGRTAAELSTADFLELTHPDDREADLESRENLLRGVVSRVTRIKRYHHKDGHPVWVRLSAAVLRDAKARARGTIAVIEDITAQRQAEEAVVRQARIYHAIARSIPRGAVLMFDRDLKYLAADGSELLSSLGLAKADLEGKDVREVVSSELRDTVVDLYRRVLSGESCELETQRSSRSLSTRLAPVWDGTQVIAGIALVQDVTEERNRAAALRRANALFEATVGNIRDGVVVIDAQNRVVLANRAYAELLGLELADVIGATRAEFLAHVSQLVEDPDEFVRRIETAGPDVAETRAEFVLLRPRRRNVRRTSTLVDLPEGPGRLVIWEDISAEVELLAERERQALTDALTGIPNRRSAEQVLDRELARSQRSGTPFSVALFDIDHFKRVNDLHGHATGDEVLRRVAAKLESARRITDSVARWGGEEFLAIVPVPIEGALSFAERVRAMVATVACPGVGRVTISAGVAEYRPGDDRNRLVERADRALYNAKANGRNRVESLPPLPSASRSE